MLSVLREHGATSKQSHAHGVPRACHPKLTLNTSQLMKTSKKDLKKTVEGVRKKFAKLKEEYARHSAEIAGKKLDLATLERQYHDAR
jgi:hypothetical protein